MAKYDVTHACGHQETVRLFGKHAERERKLAWLADQDCDECRRIKFNAANAAQAEAIRADGRDAGLPPLVGSEKQVAWAETLRAAKIVEAENWAIEAEARHDQIAEGDPGKAQADALLDQIGRGLARLRGVTEARWWIDHRTSDGVALVRDEAKIARALDELEALPPGGAARYVVPYGTETAELYPSERKPGQWVLNALYRDPSGTPTRTDTLGPPSYPTREAAMADRAARAARSQLRGPIRT